MIIASREVLSPENAALIVIDKQHGYFSPACVEARGKTLPEGAEAVVDRIDSMVVTARQAGVDVVWTCMTEDAEGSPPPISWLIENDSNGVRTIARPGERSYDFYGNTAPAPGEKVIHKLRYDAFAGTDLAEHLSDRGKTVVILMGGYATRCVLSTAVGANNHGFLVVVPTDAVVSQERAEWEEPAFHALVNAILGKTVQTGDVTTWWQRYIMTQG